MGIAVAVQHCNNLNAEAVTFVRVIVTATLQSHRLKGLRPEVRDTMV